MKINIFYSYSHKDESLQKELAKHLSILRRQGVIKTWHDRKITPGREWEGQIDQHMNSADIILLLISSDFIASDYCYDIELKRSIERHHAGDAIVIPIILRPVDWKGSPFEKLQALPTDAKPVTSWSSLDEAFFDIAKGLRKVCEELQESSTNKSAPSDRKITPLTTKKVPIKGEDLAVSSPKAGPVKDSFSSKKQTIVDIDVFCSRCGLRPGAKTSCVGSQYEHAFKQYKGSVYCSRCGIIPGSKTTCVGSQYDHDFKSYSGTVYCGRCGIAPGSKTTCVGSQYDHEFETL